MGQKQLMAANAGIHHAYQNVYSGANVRIACGKCHIQLLVQ